MAFDNWAQREQKLQWNDDGNSNIFIERNVFEHVAYMAAILSGPQCVDVTIGLSLYDMCWKYCDMYF